MAVNNLIFLSYTTLLQQQALIQKSSDFKVWQKRKDRSKWILECILFGFFKNGSVLWSEEFHDLSTDLISYFIFLDLK